jgi:thioredoxin 1
MPFDTPLNSNAQSFDRVLGAGLPVLATFYTGALDSAREDALKALAKEHAGNLLIAKIRADENASLAQKFAVRTTTALTFQSGSEYSRAENPSAEDLRAHAAYVLGRGPKPMGPPTADSRPRAEAHPTQNGQPLKVTDATFARDVLSAPLPVMVDFWAEWCGPCRMITPALEKLAREYAGRARIAKLNVDENPRTAAQYQVQGIPTLLLVKNGKIVDRIVGALPEAQLRNQIERLLKN